MVIKHSCIINECFKGNIHIQQHTIVVQLCELNHIFNCVVLGLLGELKEEHRVPLLSVDGLSIIIISSLVNMQIALLGLVQWLSNPQTHTLQDLSLSSAFPFPIRWKLRFIKSVHYSYYQLTSTQGYTVGGQNYLALHLRLRVVRLQPLFFLSDEWSLPEKKPRKLILDSLLSSEIT